MTEAEALAELKSFPVNCLDFREQMALDMAIEALEEVQRYRAIGTVEGFERAIQSSIENYNLYREYKAKAQEVAKEYGKDTNVRSNGWIPCSERLPEPYKKVLVYEEDGEIYMAKYHADIKRFSHVRSAWCVRENEVVAWMPLPIAPYQKGE